jgi:hypothetical protein
MGKKDEMLNTFLSSGFSMTTNNGTYKNKTFRYDPILPDCEGTLKFANHGF